METVTPQTTTTTTQAAQTEAAPLVYDFKAPEGTTADEAMLGKFSDWCKAESIAPDKGQALLNQILPAMAEQQQAQIQELSKAWVDEIKADREIGGDRFDATVSSARKALEQFGSPELRDWLNQTQMGNHPLLVKAFAKAGAMLKEDNIIPGGVGHVATNQAGSLMQQAAAKLYPSMQ